jgi:hypothetical protein
VAAQAEYGEVDVAHDVVDSASVESRIQDDPQPSDETIAEEWGHSHRSCDLA